MQAYAEPPLNKQMNEYARAVAEMLELELIHNKMLLNSTFALVITQECLEIRELDHQSRKRTFTQGGLSIDLTKIDTVSPMGRCYKQPLLRSIGLKSGNDLPLTVLDCTAGYGQDAWLLASFGCEITTVERQPIMHMLLHDALERIKDIEPAIYQNLTLIHADAKAILQEAIDEGKQYDIVLMDPMFPEKRKATQRKSMQYARVIVGDDEDQDGLIELALRVARRRVSVKRPTQAPFLGGLETGMQHHGKGFRFDVYPMAQFGPGSE